MNPSGHMLPFHLPLVSQGYASLRRGARVLGEKALAAASESLSALLGVDVVVRGRCTPGLAEESFFGVRLSLAFGAVPAAGALEVDAALIAGLVDRLAGGDGTDSLATALTPVESSVLELLALTALDGVCKDQTLDTALSPRLVRGGRAPQHALCVELEFSGGELRGRGRLLLEPSILEAIRGLVPSEVAEPFNPILPVSYRSGTVTLLRDEFDALAPGDVVLLDEAAPAEPNHESLVLPGGFRARGSLEEEGFHVIETGPTTRYARLPVTLDVEIAKVDLTLGDLSAMEPGAIIPLNIDRRGRVTLRAGERWIADGEIVEIEGALGVRIISLAAAEKP